MIVGERTRVRRSAPDLREWRSFLLQYVPNPAHGLQQARAPALLELLTQIADVHVDHVTTRPKVETPDGIEQLLAAQDLARISHEVLQQIELFRRRRDQLVSTADLARRQVHDDVGIAQGAASPWCPAPEQRPHPSEELLVSKRLDQIVVSSLVESFDTVRRAVLGGEQ